MMAVIFEVTPRAGKARDYFDLAAELRGALEGIDGFISVERFQSLANAEKYLSISFWRDAAAVRAWHEQADHVRAQAKGRSEIFADFRIRVAEVVRDYDMSG